MSALCLVAKTCNFISFGHSQVQHNINTTEVDPHSDSMHDGTVKPKNRVEDGLVIELQLRKTFLFRKYENVIVIGKIAGKKENKHQNQATG